MGTAGAEFVLNNKLELARKVRGRMLLTQDPLPSPFLRTRCSNFVEVLAALMCK